MTETTVVNVRDGAKGRYIGRGGPWGNPFVIGRDGNRDEVIAKFREWGETTGLRYKARSLRGEVLVCFCAPAACHGDVLAEWADEEPKNDTSGGAA